jgi:Zn-dependent protease
MNFIQTLAISALPIIFAITLHEAAHGYVARHFGDPTAWQLGRISLNPLRHVDLVGTLLVPALILLSIRGWGCLFGWAKPVPVDFGKLRRPKQDMLWVAAAGPGANLVMALIWALVFKLAIGCPRNTPIPRPEGDGGCRHQHQWRADDLNLLPLPPLDGGRIVVSLLPHRAAWKFAQLERWGFPILLALLFTGLLAYHPGPFLGMFNTLIRTLFGF